MMHFNVFSLSESVYVIVLEAEDTVTRRVWDLTHVVMDSVSYFFFTSFSSSSLVCLYLEQLLERTCNLSSFACSDLAPCSALR